VPVLVSFFIVSPFAAKFIQRPLSFLGEAVTTQLANFPEHQAVIDDGIQRHFFVGWFISLSDFLLRT
jgi:hypothetical protein